MQYTAAVDVSKGVDYYEIIITIKYGPTIFTFNPEDPDSLIDELRNGLVEEYYWDPKKFGFHRSGNIITWIVDKDGDGFFGGKVVFQTPYDESFTKMLKDLPAQVDAAIARRNSTG